MRMKRSRAGRSGAAGSTVVRALRAGAGLLILTLTLVAAAGSARADENTFPRPRVLAELGYSSTDDGIQ